MTASRPTEQVISIIELVILGDWFGICMIGFSDRYDWLIWKFQPLLRAGLSLSYYLAWFTFVAFFVICTYRALVGPSKHRLAGILFGLFPLWCAALLLAMYQAFIALS